MLQKQKLQIICSPSKPIYILHICVVLTIYLQYKNIEQQQAGLVFSTTRLAAVTDRVCLRVKVEEEQLTRGLEEEMQLQAP